MTHDQIVWRDAAEILGWKWSAAYDGYINDNHRSRPGTRPIDWDSYEVAHDAEEACFRDGLETITQAENHLRTLGRAR